MYTQLLQVLLLAITVIVCCAEPRRYDGYKLLRITPTTDEQVRSLEILRDVIQDEVDVWKDIRSLGSPVDIMISPELEEPMMALFSDYSLSSEIIIEDIQKLIDDQMRPSDVYNSNRVERSIAGIGQFNYDAYHTLDEINSWMDHIVSSYSDIVSKVEVGSSYEERTIYALKIGKPHHSVRKPIVWLQGGIHAREWVSPATLIYMTNELVTKYESETNIRSFVDNLDIYIIPVFNVDGYVYSWTDDRFWRKTLSPNSNSDCIGTDPNRNLDWHWGELGANELPCNNTYCGSEAFSEIEVQSVASYMSSLADSGGDIRVFIDFHSYSQMWMSPWAYTNDQPIHVDYHDQIHLQGRAVAALHAVYGTVFGHGTVANTIYKASGTMMDWAYGTLGIKYSYSVELRDTGHYGFTLPAHLIEPTAIETFEGLKVILEHVKPRKRTKAATLLDTANHIINLLSIF